MSNNLQDMIDGLLRMANAPRNQWLTIAHKVGAVPRLLAADGGVQAVNIATAARVLAPTFAYVVAESEQEARGVLTGLANILANERAALGDKARPYHLRGEG